jgi:hypothetical protein
MTFQLGQHVEHSTWGLGKVLFVDADAVHVYFHSLGEPVPEKRVKLISSKGWHFLTAVEAQPDNVLDQLPLWNGKEFRRPKSDVTIAEAKRTFFRMFDGGIDDPAFYAKEFAYKRLAMDRFNQQFLPRARGWIAAGDAAAIANGIDEVWGKHLPSKYRLNLLYHMGEAPAYFEALHKGGPATVAYAQALLDLLESNTDAAFDRFSAALGALPMREGGTDIAKWATLTWLPFIADPARHIVVRSSIIQAFASAYPRELNFKPQINGLSYRCILEFVEDFRRVLQASEINRSGRELDLMDVQSFMWAVAKYKKIDVDKAAKLTNAAEAC